MRPKTFVGAERLGVFEILFDWIREGRRIPILGDGSNRYQLLAVEDLVDAVVRAAAADVAGETLNVGATEFGTVRSDLEALIRHAGSASRLRPGAGAPGRGRAARARAAAGLAARGVALPHRAPRLVRRRRRARSDLLGWAPRLSNERALTETYDWYLAQPRAACARPGVTHRVPWNQQALGLLKRLS